MAVVVARLYHLDVSFSNLRLLGKLLFQIVESDVQVAVKEPAHQSQGKHIAALHHSLVVHAAVSQRVLHHLCQPAGNHPVGVDAHFVEVVVSLEVSLLEVGSLEGVSVNYNSGIRLGVRVVHLQRSRVHSHQHVTLVARRIDLLGTYVHLKTAHACKAALRGADIGGIVGEGADAVAGRGGHSRENVAGQLHTVAGVTGKQHYHIMDVGNLH